MNIKMNLLEDWTEYLQQQINEAGYALNKNDSSEIISYKYFNIKKRRVSSVPRKIFENGKLSCPKNFEDGYNNLKTKFVNGEDVNPYLSKSILKDDFDDALLNDWGIHHFHLGDLKAPQAFSDRSEPLLFALIQEKEVYFISILNHGNWTNQEFIEIIHNNWPYSIKRYQLKGFVAENQLTNDQIAKLRKNGIQTMVNFNGVVYAPIGGGYSLAGTSMQVTMEADRFKKRIINIEKHINKNSEKFLQKIKELSLPIKEELHFKLYVNEIGFHVIEVNANISFLVDSFDEK